MAIMFLSNENFTCPNGQSMLPDINLIENSVDPDQLASEEASRSGPTLFLKQHASLK